MKRRIVITGIGLVTPIGIGKQETWEALIQGRSGAAMITQFDASELPSKFACEVKNFTPEKWIDKRTLKNLDRFSQFAIVAAELAKEDACLEFSEEEGDRVGVFVGAGLGGVLTIIETHKRFLEKGHRHGVSPFFVPSIIINMAPGQISMRLGAKGPILSQVSACSSGAHAIGEAYHCIERGDADVMLAGGTEATIHPLGISGFNAAKALSTRNDEPERASRPFDAQRDGFVIGEGAGIMILEEMEHAKKRRADIYAELVGYGLTSDAHHMTAPAPDGDGAKRCMRMALKKAHLAPDSVSYINAHGTSTKYNDVVETSAIKQVFGDHAQKLSISSSKSMVGHMLGAAGGVEAAITALTLSRGAIHPTINYESPDPDCDLDYTPNQPREQKVQVAMSNSFGFGGANACLVMQQFA